MTTAMRSLLLCLLKQQVAEAAASSSTLLTISVDPARISLAQAQLQARRAIRADRHRNIVVQLGAGTHRIAAGEGLWLTAEDSPAPGHTLTWRGAAGATVVSGGAPVGGWAPMHDPTGTLPPGVMAAPAPTKLAIGATARHLFVNGVRALRTRMNASMFNASVVAAAPWPLAGCRWPGLCLDTNKTKYSVASTAPLNWSNPQDIEFIFSGAGGRGTESMFDGYKVACWAEPRCTVGAIMRGTNSTVDFIMKNPAFYNVAWRDGPITVNRPGTPPFIWIENVREHLSEPGQWYFDRTTRQVLYLPFPGQNMSEVTAVLALEQTLVHHQNVSNVQWQDIIFEHGTVGQQCHCFCTLSRSLSNPVSLCTVASPNGR